MRITQSMKLTNWTYNQKRSLISFAIKWCKKNIESCKKTKIPLSYVVKKYEKDNVTYGGYSHDDNKILIHFNNINNLKLLLCTVIHEYQHSVQPMMIKYTSYSKKYGYWRNPLEIEAREAEKKHFNNLYKYIKKIYNEN